LHDVREQSGIHFVFAINEQRIKPKQKKVMKKFIALVALVLVSASTMMYAQESNAAARRAERKAQRDAEEHTVGFRDVEKKFSFDGIVLLDLPGKDRVQTALDFLEAIL
jgi:hypothetical protein